MTDISDNQEYRLALKSVPAKAIDQVVEELVELFPLEPASARQIVQAVPIVLIDKLTAQQARNAESHLGFLRRLGAEAGITNDPLPGLKRMTLPVKPDIVRRPANVLICPTCGDRLVVQPLRSSHAADPAQARAAAPAGGPAVVESAANTPKTQKASEQPPAAPRPIQPPEPELLEETGIIILDDEEDEDREAAAREPAAAPGPEVDDEPHFTILEEDEPFVAEPESDHGAEIVGLDEAETASGGGTCRISVAKKLKPQQKKKLVELLAKYQGITLGEAAKATQKSFIIIARNATWEQAEECKSECKALGIPVKISER